MKCLLRDTGSNKISCAVSHDVPKLDLEAAADKKKMEDSGSPSLIDHEETMENSHPPVTVVPVPVDSGKSLAFPTRYEDASTGVIANVTSVGDLREKSDIILEKHQCICSSTESFSMQAFVLWKDGR